MTHRDGLHFDYRQGGVSLSAVAGKFRHRVPGVGMLIFFYAHARQQFAFDDNFRTRNRFFIYGHTLHQLDGSLT